MAGGIRLASVRWITIDGLRENPDVTANRRQEVMSTLSRRDFAKAGACASLGTFAASCSPRESQPAPAQATTSSAPPPSAGPGFPKAFFWGVATASYQIEGAGPPGSTS